MEFDCHYHGRSWTHPSNPHTHSKIDMEILSMELKYSKPKHILTLTVKAHEHKASVENKEEDGIGNNMHNKDETNHLDEANTKENPMENTDNMHENSTEMKDPDNTTNNMQDMKDTDDTNNTSNMQEMKTVDS
jgi:hypothetical protein